MIGALITLRGVVQGVGFRPFVHRLARENDLAGSVRNFSGGVVIEVEGSRDRVEEFYRRVSEDAPPMANVVTKRIQSQPPRGLETFSVRESALVDEEFVLVPPDICLCRRCQEELLDPRDRRHRYPFINCTDCGPRFTIISDMPYDRPMTTMRAFNMCDQCQREYEDIEDRRYHAQPNACPICGPHLWFRDQKGYQARGEKALQEAIERLRRGQIVAVKGIGGFHFCCDATNDQAVARLRRRKNRPTKPLAIMSLDLNRVRSYCRLSPAEEQLLSTPMRPIVILERRADSPIAAQVAPGSNTLGVMLPYAPVHVLLLEGDPVAIVATSANLSDQPLVRSNQEAREQLSQIADAYLFHNREIHTSCDDSIFRFIAGQPMPIRRARGYAPSPIRLPFESPPILACGGELKSTFCLTREDNAFLSQHIGDLKNAETYQFYLNMIQRFQHLFRVQPMIVAHDLHPQYLSTRFARELSEGGQKELKRVAVQHHHAHVGACMAENGVVEPVIGVVFDGLGYGADGHIWGAEFMVADYKAFHRMGQLRYVPLPGGDVANREPWRMALSHLYSLCGPELGTWERSLFSHLNAQHLEGVLQMLVRGYNAPLVSSMGRLFDAVSSLLGLCQHNTYEGEAAVNLQVTAENISDPLPGYSWSISRKGDYITVDPNPLFSELLQDLRRHMTIPEIARRFHQSVAELVGLGCRHIRAVSNLSRVALSGGVFQNKLLTELTVDLLRRDGFEPLLHQKVPPNDGGIALGQAAVAGYQNRKP
ncbi:MAG: hypothetical protein AMJ92_01205 [candidate division Zixibacteria bacterium SM23_81]|nr:MAG: hypothetical protein AMJ92_01205 [candidate division Zixibacteria bacterium SM23_81]